MGTRRKKLEKVKLFSGFIFSDKHILDKTLKILKKKYGEIDSVSGIFDFDITTYYNKEMGDNLKKIFVSFKRLIKREDMPDIKIFTNKIEKKFSDKNGNRKINIDPGYITFANLTLATTKDYQHRIYIGKGIFLENTLRYRRGEYTDWEWTYPDFKTKEYKDYFLKVLALYKNQIREKK